MSNDEEYQIIRYDLDIGTVITGDPITSLTNIFELLNGIVGTMVLPDEQSEQGFLSTPMARFYKKIEHVRKEDG